MTIMMPAWTERLAKRGLDPLGMQNSGVLLYQQLVPGVSNVTLRIRYYGLYCWASEIYARRIALDDARAWRKWIRSLEALHALVAELNRGEAGVAGILWAAEMLGRGSDPINFSDGVSLEAGIRQYLIYPLGVFGQAYLSQMEEVGLFRSDSAAYHELPLRTEMGRSLAENFAAAIGSEVERLLISAIEAEMVTRAELAALAPILPSKVDRTGERDAYERLLFSRGDHATEKDVSRRQTFLLILYAAHALGRRPKADEIRSLLFAAELAIPPVLERQRLRWEAYQAQDMWQVAAAALLRWVIDKINEYSGGLSIGEIHAALHSHIESLGEKFGNSSWERVSSTSRLDDEAIEDHWRALLSRRHSSAEKIEIAIVLMAALAHRLEQRADLAAEVEACFPFRSGGRSLRTEMAWLHQRRQEGLAELIADYATQRVINRHSQVAMQKLRRQRDYTFLFEAREGRLAFRACYDPVATTPRLDPAIQFLVDIDLIGETGLTAAGRSVLAITP